MWGYLSRADDLESTPHATTGVPRLTSAHPWGFQSLELGGDMIHR